MPSMCLIFAFLRLLPLKENTSTTTVRFISFGLQLKYFYTVGPYKIHVI